MKKLRLLSVVCACVLPLVVINPVQAVPVQYSYAGNDFTANNDPKPMCNFGDAGCFSHITASIALSTALAANQGLTTITPDAWSISDGMTTITDQTAQTDGFSLFGPLQVGTDGSGKINEWRFIVQRLSGTTQLEDELIFMQTINSSGANDSTAYCRVPNGTFCDTAATISVINAGSWTMTTPLPAAVWLFASGLLGLLGITRRRRPA